MNTRIVALLWIILFALLLPLATRAQAETTLVFTANSLGEHSPCPT
jgi:predicted secreted protein